MRLKFWKKQDWFRLDTHREVMIDGKPHIITGFSADGSYADLTRLTVDFEPTDRYINRNIDHAMYAGR
jgi:hypothetical protein